MTVKRGDVPWTGEREGAAMKPNALIRPLRAIAAGGGGDMNLLAGRAANEIERLEERIADLARLETLRR